MDDDFRLLRLSSLVGWADPESNRCGLRYGSEEQQQRLTEAEQVSGHLMVSDYSGALLAHQGSTRQGDILDRDGLPGVTLKFVTNLSPDAVHVLGIMIRSSLMLAPEVDPDVLGAQWVRDVTDTCWRLAMTRRQDRFGLDS
ncbi:hypothetical protein BC739_009379 [Kutzneria viridogrisea]|uniref:Uncharacterized protein n=1 Tax=Kutzneria viridogrisea TaxID=47990 RepID=A0ABR6BZ47_9PSEU|nr:hypothetical protein [Kutzneria viridogrisea]